MLELTWAIAMKEPSELKVRIRSPSFTPRFAASSGFTKMSGSPRCRLSSSESSRHMLWMPCRAWPIVSRSG